jgi:hypothetical protein
LTLQPAVAQQTNSDLGLRGDLAPIDGTSSQTLGLRTGMGTTGAMDNGIDNTNNGDNGTGDNGSGANGNSFPGAANYGKPKLPNDPTKRYTGRPTTFKNSLSPLVSYPSSATAVQRKTGSLQSQKSTPSPTTATLPPILKKPKPKVDIAPFAPVGVYVGSLRLVPYVEVDRGYDSNPNQQTSNPQGSPTLRGETGFTLQSLWSVHQLTGELHAGYTDDLKLPKASSPDGNSKFDLRLDATRDTAIDLEARGAITTQSAGSPILGTSQVSERPLVATFGGTAGVTQAFGDASLGLHGTIDRTVYSNATQPGGSTLELTGDSYNAYGLKTRAGYMLTPGVMPFVEVDVDTRVHDQPLDSSGYARNSNGQAAMAGSTFELSRILTGEIDAGYAQREYVDPRLAHLHGPTFDAALIWSATPLSTITLKGNTTLSETTVAGSAGAVTRTISLELAHQLFYNVRLDALGSYSTNTYQGVNLFEQTYTGTFTAEYDLSRWLALRATASTQHFVSTAPNANYTEDKFMIGLRLQR